VTSLEADARLWSQQLRDFDLTKGDPNQVGHQTFICWIVLTAHVTED
jgi:hypothetical protein